MDIALGFKDSIEKKSWQTHQLLLILVNDGKLERCKKGKGFKYKSQLLKNKTINLSQDREDYKKIKSKALVAQEDLLATVLCIFRKNKHMRPLGPSDITRELNLCRGLNEKTQKQWDFTGQHNDKLAQGLINELLNRGKIKRVKSYGRWIGYQYDD